MSRLRLAYALNDHYAAIVRAALWPHALFPLELWRKTHEQFWRGFSDTVASFYSIVKPEFPDSDAPKEKYFYAHLYAEEMQNLFSMLASRIHVNALREGLRYIVSMTYENIENVTFQDKMDSLFEQLSTIEENNDYKFTQNLPKQKFIALMEEKIFSIPPSSYFFISKMYEDTILVDSVSAIRQLRFLKIPFKTEVKGITQELVDSVHKALAEEAASAIILTGQPQEQATTPPSTGSRKDFERIKATREICEELVQELLQERQTFENSRNTWKPNLLRSNGKTNFVIFFKTAMKHLGNKPHRAAARAVWEKVPGNLKHNGRMPEE